MAQGKVEGGWPQGAPPREKLLALGAAALSDRELLALFLRTGLPGVHVIQLAERLLLRFGSLQGVLRADVDTFCASQAGHRQVCPASGGY